MDISSEVGATIRKYAVKNAVDYGKASQGNVLNKVLSVHPELKSDIKAVSKEVGRIVDEVNGLGTDALRREYSGYKEEFESAADERAKKTAKPKFVLDGVAEGGFIGRASPEPSGYAHMGHAKQALLNYEFARVYRGKMYLYFDDTNPEKARQEYVDAIRRDLNWLGIHFDKEYYASDNIETMYGYARQLLESGRAYVCQCDREEMKKYRMDGIECRHRAHQMKTNMELFERMVAGGLGEGEAIVRFKGNMKSQNTVLRDPALLRIVKAPHYRVGTKYSVWPLYDFNTPILDSVNGITDIIRSKEYELRDELVERLLESLGLRVPRTHLEARLNIKGNVVQKRVIRQLIADGYVKTWDDPRLMTLMALRRRGILPEAIREFVLRFGMSKTDSTVDIEMLLAENKRLIEPVAKHLFFVRDPVRVVVNGAVGTDVKIRLHPENDLGLREYRTGSVFYISRGDADRLGVGQTVRLKDLMAIRIVSINGTEITAERGDGGPRDSIIQWVSEGNYARCSVMIPGDIVDAEDNFNPNSLEIANGYVESYAERLHDRDIVQFERFAYCVLDNKESMQFILTSK